MRAGADRRLLPSVIQVLGPALLPNRCDRNDGPWPAIGDAPGGDRARGIWPVVQLVAVRPSVAWAGVAAPPRRARAATIMPVRVAAAATRTPRSAPVTNAVAAVWNRAAPCGPPTLRAMAAAAPSDCRAAAVAPGPAAWKAPRWLA